MASLPLTYSSVLDSIEITLLLVISCVIITALLFFLMTLFKKINRIREIQQKKKFQIEVDNLLFNYLFNEQSLEEVTGSGQFQQFLSSPLFQRVAIKSIIGLHQNYSGIYKAKLEEVFAASGLATYSLKKLNSSHWPHIVEGIRDLSGLNYQKAYPRIVSHQNHKNRFVKTEVLLGMIKLKGISEIQKFKDRDLYLNDWVQSNILFAVKKHKIPAPENLEKLLRSKNKSIVLLAVRLVNYYSSVEHYDLLADFYFKTDDIKLKQEISSVLNKSDIKIH